MWVRFPVLPVEYYIERWLKKTWNGIGRTIKVDIATLLASRGKFAHVCTEVDLRKPLMAGYRLRREFWRLQYEGLHDISLDVECTATGKLHVHLRLTSASRMKVKEVSKTWGNSTGECRPKY